jgi:hypothetical protein
LTPFFVGFLLCLITCIVSAIIQFVEEGFNKPFRVLFLFIVIVLPALIWIEQAVVGNLRKRINLILLIETIVLVLLFILLSLYATNAANTGLPK